MGIKHLNIFLKDNCSEAIKCVSMADLSGKKIAVDISIYLYKYIGDDSLIENMYLMISMFRYYNIIPIFIFDGKPPAEKKELLIKRRKDKIFAENEYNRLKNQLDSIDINNEDEDEDELEKQEIISNMDSLKKRFIYVSKNQIEKVKELITSYGVTYYDAPGEADELCAMLVLKKKVWGCMSEDMDLFAYGCPRVLRYFSLINRSAVVYVMKDILDKLDVTLKEFRQICILAGTDYNSDNYNNKNECDLKRAIKLFKKYTKSKDKGDFYDWIYEKFPECVNDISLLKNIYKIFDLSDDHIHLKIYDDITIENTPIIKEKMYQILEEDGFVFGNYSCD